MKLKRCISVFDEDGRFNPVYDEDETLDVAAENILMAVGQSVDLSFLDEKYQVQLTGRGLIDVEEEDGMTSRPGVFAGGDAVSGPGTVIGGISTGRTAAFGMNKYLGISNAPLIFSKGKPDGPFLSFDPDFNEKKTAAKLKELPAGERGIDKEDSFGLSEEEAFAEAARCMNCGCYAVNSSDIAPVLIALDAKIVTTVRTLSAEECFCSKLKIEEMLAKDELIKRIEIPVSKDAVAHYDKFRLRNAVDFAIVSVSSVFKIRDGKIKDAKIVLGSVAPIPLRVRETEDFLSGKKITKDVAEEAATIATQGALSFEKNKYKLIEVEELLKNSILRAG
jgi:CO/xanthine dehydrogenase FAD-binding subunit